MCCVLEGWLMSEENRDEKGRSIYYSEELHTQEYRSSLNILRRCIQVQLLWLLLLREPKNTENGKKEKNMTLKNITHHLIVIMFETGQGRHKW